MKRFLRGAFQVLFLTLQGAVSLSFFWDRFLYFPILFFVSKLNDEVYK
ncbi:hypothetical protein LEP1GSC161_3291 [Leptospira santarosai str. CBC1416]|uniref:Uncharacterized protein n=1 Tax=Leptospira santarosai str. CBC1416 TaxID=1193059 RepID=M6VTE1_9LEPT|nr:hypothetical protein LEP1GSC161_3291 [Leptospira santarosai str. CBC1416]